MTSTNRTTIAARVARGVAAGALVAGIAVGEAATAGAERVWDIWKYDFCMLSAPDIEDNPVAYYDYRNHRDSPRPRRCSRTRRRRRFR